jgi:hypothetical protein
MMPHMEAGIPTSGLTSSEVAFHELNSLSVIKTK